MSSLNFLVLFTNLSVDIFDIMSYYIFIGKHIEIYGRKARSLRQLCYDSSVAFSIFGVQPFIL